MKTLQIILFVLVCYSVILPQDKYIRGKVVYLSENNVEEKQKGVTVIVEQTGDRNVTDNDGIFVIQLSGDFNAGDHITLAIEKRGWEIRDPLKGNMNIPADTKKELITINILPKGSLLFLTDPQIKKYILSFQNQRFDKDREFSPARGDKFNFELYLDTLATKFGISASDMMLALNKWIEKVHKDTGASYEKGLAELTKGNFNTAGMYFKQSVDEKEASLKEIEPLTSKKDSLLEEIIRDSHLQGESFYIDKNYLLSNDGYKKAIYYLRKKSSDFDLLVLTLNKVAQNYFLLSRRSADNSKIQYLDSAETFLNEALIVVNKNSIKSWEYKIKGNLTIINTESAVSSPFKVKDKSLQKAINDLKDIETERKNSNSYDWIMARYDIGILYNMLYEYTKDLDSACYYLDNSINSFSFSNDSLFKQNYPSRRYAMPLSLSGVLLAKADLLCNNKRVAPWLISYFALLGLDNLCDFIESSYNNESRKNAAEQLKEAIDFAENSIKFLREETEEDVLAAAINLLVMERIRFYVLTKDSLPKEFLTQTLSLTDEAKKISSEHNLPVQQIYSMINDYTLRPFVLLNSKTLGVDTLTSCINLLRNELDHSNYIYPLQASIKRVILLYYIIIIPIIDDEKQKAEYIDEAELAINELHNIYTGLSDFRMVDELKNISLILNCLKD